MISTLKPISTTGAPSGTPPPKPTHSPAIIAAMNSARSKMNALLQRHKSAPFKTWEDLAKHSGLDIPTRFTLLPLTYLTVKNFTNEYVNETEKRINEAVQTKLQENAAVQTPAWKSDKETGEGGLLPFNLPAPFRPIPRQRKSYTQIVREMGLRHGNGQGSDSNFTCPRSHACLVPLPAGEGKTAIAAMLIKHYQDNNYFGTALVPCDNILYITPKRAKEKTRRFLFAAGIRDVGVRVIVLSYSEIRSQKWRTRFKAVQDINPIDGQPFETYTYTFAPFWPSLIIIDECHKIKKPDVKTSKLIYSFLGGAQTRWLYMSATAAVCVNDLFGFSIASRKTWTAGQPITKANWKEVAWGIGKADPKKPNGAAMERFAEFFGDAIVKPPADPRKVKCYNSITTIAFDNDKDRAEYNSAEEAWLETAERLGKITNERMNVMAAFTVFRAAEEKIKARYLAKLAYDELCKGRAPVIAVCYIETVKRVYAELCRYTHPRTGKPICRENISVIWGGEKIISEDQCYTMAEFTTLMIKVNNSDDGILCLDKTTRAKYNKTKKYLQDRWRNKGETIDEQRERIAWLKETRLDAQNEGEQQEEVDRFQKGDSDICIFTLAAGGTAIDLDQQREDVMPRTMLATICYYGEEFVQAFGRCYRVSTVSDVYQRVIFFQDTIVANHVAPKLGKKLASMNKFSATGVNLEEQLVAAIATGKVKAEKPEPIEVQPVEQESMEGDDEGDEDADEED